MLETIVQIMSLIGIPSIFSLLVILFKFIAKIIGDVSILQSAQKAQMRAQLLKDYEFYKARKYVLQVELDEWMNQYRAYHKLVGENEVLDDRKEKIKEFDNQPPVEEG